MLAREATRNPAQLCVKWSLVVVIGSQASMSLPLVQHRAVAVPNFDVSNFGHWSLGRIVFLESCCVSFQSQHQPILQKYCIKEERFIADTRSHFPSLCIRPFKVCKCSDGPLRLPDRGHSGPSPRLTWRFLRIVGGEQLITSCMKFEVFTAGIVKNLVSWEVNTFNAVDSYECFRLTYMRTQPPGCT
jgi:hypothetical protein